MSLLGLSSYFLWSEKGFTTLPMVRGSCFVAATKLKGFYSKHVVTASHVANPVKYKHIFGSPQSFNRVGERHVSTQVLRPLTTDWSVGQYIPLQFTKKMFSYSDVCALRPKHEDDLKSMQPNLPEIQCFDFDDEAQIGAGLDVVLSGVRVKETQGMPTDETLHVIPTQIVARTHSLLETTNYGRVVLCDIEADAEGLEDIYVAKKHSVSGEQQDGESEKILERRMNLGMCGGPVLNPQTGKCIGVIVAAVRTTPAPPRITDLEKFYKDPFIDLTPFDSMPNKQNIRAAFCPINEFISSLRAYEM